MTRIMVVDDEKDMALLFQHEFRQEIKRQEIGFHFALSGEEALSYMETSEATDLVLILSDVNMPGINGLELLKILKDRWINLPVIIITACDKDYNYEKAREYQADGFLTKPIDFSELRDIISSYMT